jgi:tetratricopeptide (TPR) repeat protein
VVVDARLAVANTIRVLLTKVGVSIMKSAVVSGERSEGRLRAQYLACLVATGRRDVLVDEAGVDPAAIYHLGLLDAREGRREQALATLRGALGANGNDLAARRLTYKLLIHEAKMRASQSGDGVGDLIAEALRVAPHGHDVESDLGQLQDLLPIAEIRSGNRMQAARRWEAQLKTDPHALRLLHHLALVNYWGAVNREEGADSPECGEMWRCAIGYWTALTACDVFWERWRNSRQTAWGFPLTKEDLGGVRGALLEERFDSVFVSRADGAIQRGHKVRATFYQDLLTASILERRTARLWKEAMVKAGSARPPQVGIPGGYLFFSRLGLLPEVLRLGSQAFGTTADSRKLVEFTVCFSPLGLGSAMVLVEDRNRPDEALAALSGLPSPSRDAPEACYLVGVAYAKKGKDAAEHADVSGAVQNWLKARQAALELAKRPGCPAPFKTGVDQLLQSIAEHAVKTVKKEASRLKNAGQTDKALALLESVLPVDRGGEILEYQCIFLCEMAMEKVRAEKHQEGRAIFEKVLKLKPGFTRANDGMATSYNNEACEVGDRNIDRAIELLDKAVSLDPKNHGAERNLATFLKIRAIQLANAITPYSGAAGWNRPLQMLERAAKLAGPNLKPGFVDAIGEIARINPEMAKRQLESSVEDELLQGILVNIVICHNNRNQARSGSRY